MKTKYNVISGDSRLNLGDISVQDFPEFNRHLVNFRASTEMLSEVKKDFLFSKATGFSMAFRIDDADKNWLVKDRLYDFFGKQQSVKFRPEV